MTQRSDINSETPAGGMVLAGSIAENLVVLMRHERGQDPEGSLFGSEPGFSRLVGASANLRNALLNLDYREIGYGDFDAALEAATDQVRENLDEADEENLWKVITETLAERGVS